MKSKNDFLPIAEQFFETLFNKSLSSGYGEIEIRVLKPYSEPNFYSSVGSAAEKALELSSNGINAYFGVNPRIGKGGEKDNVHYLTTFHAEIDYGTDHTKKSKHNTYE